MDAVSASNGGRAGGLREGRGAERAASSRGTFVVLAEAWAWGLGEKWEVFAEQTTLSQVAERKPHCSLGPLRWNVILQTPPDTSVDVCKAAGSGTVPHKHTEIHK